MPEGDFRHMYAADASLQQLFVLLLTRNFFPLVPGVRKIWAKPRAADCSAGTSGCELFVFRHLCWMAWKRGV